MNTPIELWLLVGGSILATYLWRFLGVMFARNINTDGALFQWITCVSYAMLAGLIARMVFIPTGSLTEVELWIRLVSLAIGLGAFFLGKQNVLVGSSAGLATFIALVSFS